jgi:site-specific DNA recombinase
VTGSLDLSNDAGITMARVMVAVANKSSRDQSRRIQRKYVQLAESGQPGNGGHRPFGFTKDRRALVDEEAIALRGAYAQVLAGRSLRSIAHDLTEAGHLSTTGRQWTVQALRYNLLSGRNAALREHRGQVVGAAVWPPVVDRETWERARAVLLSPGRRSVRPDGVVHDGGRRYLLSGFLYCGRTGCGHRLRPARHSSLQRFGCPPRKDGGCGGILVRYEPAEAAVVQLLLARVERDADLTPDAPPDLTAELLDRIAADERRLEALADAFADDPDGNPLELRAAGARIRSRIAAARAEIQQTATRQLVANPLEVRRAWPGYDLQQRRLVLSAMVERIDVAPAQQPYRVFQPDRLEVTWR